MDRLITALWLAILGAIVALLCIPEGRLAFEEATRAHPYLMGFVKIGLLGTMGELLGKKIAGGRWKLTGIRLWQRALVWGVIGMGFAVVFPLFSFGVDGLLEHGLLPGRGQPLVTAFWKSFFMNTIFAFPMMVSHRITDTLIERGQLFSRWPLISVFVGLDWNALFRVVGFACLWFWIPAHTLTFSLAPELRVLSAALLAIVLGLIMGFAGRRNTGSEPAPARDAEEIRPAA